MLRCRAMLYFSPTAVIESLSLDVSIQTKGVIHVFIMKKTRLFIAIVLMAALIFPSMEAFGAVKLPDVSPSKSARGLVSQGPSEKGEIILVYKKGVSDSQIKKSLVQKDCDPVLQEEGPDGTTVALVEYSSQDSMAQALTRGEQDKKVAYAQPNYKYKTSTYKRDPRDADDIKNQWYLYEVKAKEAWSLLDGRASKVRVGVVDTGLDVYHEDLQASVNKDLGRRFTSIGESYPLTSDSEVHGTHVTGIIAGTYGNGKGIAGVASGTGKTEVINASIGLKGWMSTMEICRSMEYVASQGVRTINLSLGGSNRDYLLSDMAKYMTNEKNVLICAAAGNDSTDVYSSPSDEGEVLSVTATSYFGSPTYFTSYGTDKDIAAPGEDIVSTIPGNEYASFDGTSMAAPVVTAVSAMCFSANPELTAYQVKNILMASAEDIHKKGFDQMTGWGCVDAEAAVKAALDANTSVEPEAIEIRKGGKNIVLDPGDDKTLDPVLRPATCIRDISWSTSAPSVATVDEYGNVKALNSGVAKITASCGNVSATYNVTVTGNDGIEYLEFDSDTPDKLCVGDKYTIGTNIEDGEDGKLLKWTSSDTSVIDAHDAGEIKAASEGSATITATAYNGTSCSKTFTVTPKITDVKLTNDKGKKTFKKGEAAPTFSAAILPEGSSHKKVTFKSTNVKVLQVDPETGVSEIVGPGTARINAVIDGTTWAYMTIKVTGKGTSSGGGMIANELVYCPVYSAADKEYMAGMYIEACQDMYRYQIKQKKYYSDAVWNDIQSSYNKYMAQIEEDPENGYINCRAVIYNLGKMTKKNMGNKKLPGIKKEYTSKISKIYREKTKGKKYTGYWKQVLESNIYIAKNNIKNSSSYSDVAVSYGMAKKNISLALTDKNLTSVRKTGKDRVDKFYKNIQKSDAYKDFSATQKENIKALTQKYKGLIDKAYVKIEISNIRDKYKDEVHDITG